MNRIQLSKEEKAIIQDVQRKNFYSRALPLGLGGMLACRILIMRGSISSNRSLVKVLGCGFAGYLLGKMSVPNQIKEQLLKDCPDGTFAKMHKEFAELSPEERKAYMAQLTDKMKNQPKEEVNWPSHGESTMPTVGSSTETPLHMGSSGSMGSPPAQQPVSDSQPTFSYAEQRSKWSNTEKGVAQPPQSSQQPEFSYAQQRALNSGGIQPVPIIPQETTPPQPQSLPSSPAGAGKNVKRNQYGDEME